MRIGYLIRRFPPVAARRIAREIHELERRGARVQVLALADDEGSGHGWLAGLAAPIRVMSYPLGDAWHDLARRHGDAGGRRRVLRAVASAFEHSHHKSRRCLTEAVAVAAVCEEDGIDHLHAHFLDRPALVALCAHHLTSVPFSMTVHADDIWSGVSRPEHWRSLLRRAKFAVTLSEASKRRFVAAVGQRLGARVRRLYDSVDVSALRPNGEVQRGTDTRLLCVAPLREEHGVDVLVTACAELARRHVPFRAELVGDGPLASTIAAQISALGISARVVPRGALESARVIDAMHGADIFVLPTRSVPLAHRDSPHTPLLEAMACGLPCVATRIGVNAEIVEEGKTGRLVAGNDAEELASALLAMIANRELREQMGRAARARAEQLFNGERGASLLYEWLGGKVHDVTATGTVRSLL